jgi:hypothetical protein
VSARRGRSRGRRPIASVAQLKSPRHWPTIWAIIVLFLLAGVLASVNTPRGSDILSAVQHFLLFYAGVLALVTLTAAVGVGVVATDRVIMTPASRVVAQAVHRAVSFAALAFLAIHIVLEILAHRSHVIDAFLPFLAHGRTFYIGLGTIASDLVVLLVVTGIMRGRFVTGRPWTWRAIHATAYLAWPLAILHGLLAGRTAKPYVDWSYGACLAAVGLALVIRFVATIRNHQEKARHPLPDYVSPTVQAPMPAITQPGIYDRWSAVPQTRDLRGAVPQTRTMPRALPPGAADRPEAPASQPPYIATRRLATPRPDLPIPPPHQQEMRPWQQQEWQQHQQDYPEPVYPPYAAYPDDPDDPDDSAYPAHPGAEGS